MITGACVGGVGPGPDGGLDAGVGGPDADDDVDFPVESGGCCQTGGGGAGALGLGAVAAALLVRRRRVRG